MRTVFCPVCGTRLKTKDGKTLWCGNCAEERFPLYSTAVSAAVWNREGSALLLIRQYGESEPVFPAGYVDRGETAEDAVIRELREELDLTVESLRFLRSRFYAPSQTLMLHYAVTVCETEAKPNSEVDSWAWTPPAEADRLIRGGLARLLLDDTLREQKQGGGDELPFYGQERAPVSVQMLFEDLRHVWCAETCAPRMRADWSPDNPTLGQCSITAFLVQDLLGGEVYGIPLPDGSVHCYNKAEGLVFDLTSDQFSDRTLSYENNPLQTREALFAQADKRERYELLKRRLLDYRSGCTAEK